MFTFDAVDGDVAIMWVNVTLQGTYRTATFSSFTLVDGSSNTVARASVTGARVDFGPLSLAVQAGTSLSVRLRPEINNYDGTTIGAFLRGPTDVVARSAGVSLVGPQTAARSLAYIGAIPSTARIDGGVAVNRRGDLVQHGLSLADRGLDDIGHHAAERLVHGDAEGLARWQGLLAVA